MAPLVALAAFSLLGYHLTFDAEMGSASDMSQFINTFANGDTTLYRNREAEDYAGYDPDAATPFSFQGGALVIGAAPVPAGGLPYTSGMLETAGIFTQSAGYFEIRAETPAAQGFWPAFWLLPAAYYPEIDILEQPNIAPSPDAYWSHTSTPTLNSGGFRLTRTVVGRGFHRYGFLWTPTTIQYVFDGALIGPQEAVPPSLVGLQMYMIANLAVGGQGSWPGPPLPDAASTYTIDYIRAYSSDPAVPAVSQEPTSSPDGANTLPVLAPPFPPVPAVTGTGRDTLVLDVSEDAYAGDAVFRVSVDGQPYGGTHVAAASHAFGQTQAFAFRGDFGTADHRLTVDFLNGWPATGSNRHLYVTAAWLNGVQVGSAALDEAVPGPQSFGFTGSQAPAQTIGAGPDVVLLDISDAPYVADATFTLSVDGVPQGAAQVATALHGYGQTQAFAVRGAFGPGAHTVGLAFVTSAAGGAAADPVDLYVDALSYDGVGVTQGAARFTAGGTYTIEVPAQPPDTLSLSLAEDPFEGDALARISLDGRVLGTVTVTANAGSGTPQVVTYSGAWGGPHVAHTVVVDFLNDAYVRRGQDRNLHVLGITLDATTVTTQPQNLMRGGPVAFSYPVPAPGAGWTATQATASGANRS